MPSPGDGFYPHEKGLKGLPGAPEATRTKQERFALTVHGVGEPTFYFPTKKAALRNAAGMTSECTLLDRRTGMYLDPTTGEHLPADQQLTNGGKR